MKLGVVTPYWQESPETLARCMKTVREQSVNVTHYLIADGRPQSIPESDNLVHVRLPENIGNSGATPRGLGAQLAFNDGCDAVGFIDADNWLEHDHMQQAMILMEREKLDVVFARRNIVFPDGEVLEVDDPQDEDHVDTNCYIISRRAAFLVMVWGMWPKDFGAGEDRVMLHVIRHLKLKSGWMNSKTVWYETNWRVHHDLAQKVPVQPLRNPTRRASTHFNREHFVSNIGIRMPIKSSPNAMPIVDKPIGQWKLAVVTAYRGEGEAALRRCIASVAMQGFVVKHYIVSDGANPCPELPQQVNVQKLELPGFRNDHGATARGLGAMVTFQLGSDAVIFLDAGGCMERDHVASMLEAQEELQTSLTICSSPAIQSSQESPLEHRLHRREKVNGMMVTIKDAYLGPMWAQLPQAPNEGLATALYLRLAMSRGISARVLEMDSIRCDESIDLNERDSVQRFGVSKELVFSRMGLRAVAKRN